jgi:hypothetical protein
LPIHNACGWLKFCFSLQTAGWAKIFYEKVVNMASLEEARQWCSNKTRYHNLYCFGWQQSSYDQVIPFILIEAYRVNRRKRQAVFINEWFVKGNIPDQFKVYFDKVNVAGAKLDIEYNKISGVISDIGRTFGDKIDKQGGGLAGFFGAIELSIFGDTKPPEKLFDNIQSELARMFDTGSTGAFYSFKPDKKYQSPGQFSNLIIEFKKILTENGFDPDQIGIY